MGFILCPMLKNSVAFKNDPGKKKVGEKVDVEAPNSWYLLTASLTLK